MRFRIVFLVVLLMLAGCQGAEPQATELPTAQPLPTATPVDTGVTAQPGGPFLIGFPDLQPSAGVACVLSSSSGGEVQVRSGPDAAQPVTAVLRAGTGSITFRYQNGWYATSYVVDGAEVVGWVAAEQVQLKGECEGLGPPRVCSVQPLAGIVNIYQAPDRNGRSIGALTPQDAAVFVQLGQDGWFGVDMGGGQIGWVAPDEARLTGPCATTSP